MRICFAIFLLVLCYPGRAARIVGYLPDRTNAVVVVSEFDNFVTKTQTFLLGTTIDSTGHFSVELGAGQEKKIRVEIGGEQAVAFYVSGDNEYHLSMVEGRLTMQSSSRDRNQLNRELAKALVDWKGMWNGSGAFVNLFSYGEVVDSLRGIELTTGKKFGRYKQAIETRIKNEQLMYVAYSYAKLNKDSANAILDDMEQKYIATHKIAMDDEEYVRLFENYMDIRVHKTKVRRVSVGVVDNFERIMKEADLFPVDNVRQFAKVIGTKVFFDNKYYRPDSNKVKFSARALDTAQTLGSGMRDLLEQLVAVNNAISKGDAFPFLPVVDEQNLPFDMKKINTPYMLVDFWASWCGPCKRSMEKFPVLVDRFGDSLTIVSMSVDESLGAMVGYLTTKNYMGKWTTLYCGSASTYLTKLPVTSYPTYYLLDRDRKIIAISSGEHLDDITSLIH